MFNGYGSLGLQVAGALGSATGSYLKTLGQRNNLRASADIADLNARMSELSAKSTLRQGQREEQRVRFDVRNEKDAQTVGFAANGIALDSETAIRVATSTDVLGEIDANTINANAARAAWGYRMEGVQFENEARTTRATAGALNPFAAASTSLINSAGNISESYVKLKKAGAFEPKNERGRAKGFTRIPNSNIGGTSYLV